MRQQNCQQRTVRVASVPQAPSPGEALYVQCGLPADWDSLTLEKQQQFEVCAEGIIP